MFFTQKSQNFKTPFFQKINCNRGGGPKKSKFPQKRRGRPAAQPVVFLPKFRGSRGRPAAGRPRDLVWIFSTDFLTQIWLPPKKLVFGRFYRKFLENLHLSFPAPSKSTKNRGVRHFIVPERLHGLLRFGRFFDVFGGLPGGGPQIFTFSTHFSEKIGPRGPILGPRDLRPLPPREVLREKRGVGGLPEWPKNRGVGCLGTFFPKRRKLGPPPLVLRR